VPASHKHARTVADVMSSQVFTIGPDESLFKAARLLDRHGIKPLPVVDDEGYLLGILSRGDLVRAMTRSDDDIRQDVVEAIVILGEENFEDLSIDVTGGDVTLSGIVDRSSTRDVAVDMASRVPGVSEVADRLDYTLDDAHLKPASNQWGSDGLGHDSWAVGALVKNA